MSEVNSVRQSNCVEQPFAKLWHSRDQKSEVIFAAVTASDFRLE